MIITSRGMACDSRIYTPTHIHIFFVVCSKFVTLSETPVRLLLCMERCVPCIFFFSRRNEINYNCAFGTILIPTLYSNSEGSVIQNAYFYNHDSMS